MELICKKENCSGCTACESICPKNAIKMIEDNEGFKYPIIDENKCIKCNLCKKVCPIKNEYKKDSIKKSYVVQNKSMHILEKSTSGGLYYGIANYILENDGVIVAPDLDENNVVKHSIINNREKLIHSLGSKYVQSDLNGIYKKVKEYLLMGKLTCFSGTPCQIEGLKAYLKKEYDNLITIGIVCHGVPSPKVWRKFIIERERKYKKKIVFVNFRDKTFGYNRSGVKLYFNDGTVKVETPPDDYLDAFFSEIISRPSCYNCKFKKIERKSDFMIFDAWSAKESDSRMTTRGATNVFIYSEKGIEIFDKIKNDYIIKETKYEETIEKDGVMILNNAKANKNRSKFFEKIDDMPLKKLKKRYYPFTMKKKLVYIIKDVLNRMNLLQRIYGVKDEK